jgi:hypothetical protein
MNGIRNRLIILRLHSDTKSEPGVLTIATMQEGVPAMGRAKLRSVAAANIERVHGSKA